MRKPSRAALNAAYALCPKELIGDQSGEFELPKLSRGDVEAMITAAYNEGADMGYDAGCEAGYEAGLQAARAVIAEARMKLGVPDLGDAVSLAIQADAAADAAMSVAKGPYNE
jgi:hypothetical protein